MKKSLAAAILALAAAAAAAGEEAGVPTQAPDVGFELRYRHEAAEQSGLRDAVADTIRLRLNASTGTHAGFSAFVEVDRIEALGGIRYEDTRGSGAGRTVIADPEGTDLNQLWVEYARPGALRLRAGRQRIVLDNERFVGPVGWRQNEQTFDALLAQATLPRQAVVTWAWIDGVQRVFGPAQGTPPERLASDSHLLHLTLPQFSGGALTLYGYLLDFGHAPQLSSDTFGARFTGKHGLREALALHVTLEAARQHDAGRNPARIDAHYALAELRLASPAVGFAAGLEVLSGEREAPGGANPAFQTPLATLHPFQGWADRFTTTPADGLEDRYLAVDARRAGWTLRVAWHDFGAEATAGDYGSEWDASLARTFARRWELLLKAADYAGGNGPLPDTRRLWLQLAARW